MFFLSFYKAIAHGSEKYQTQIAFALYLRIKSFTELLYSQNLKNVLNFLHTMLHTECFIQFNCKLVLKECIFSGITH